MRYKLLGRKTGLRVSELALGTGNFGTGWGYGAERDEAKKIFDAYAAAGGNFVDTANVYQAGQSEVMLGEFIAAERDNFVLSSKYSLPDSADAGIARAGNSRKNMVRSVEESLKRLNTDRIDLFWAHMDDGMTPIDEILRGFEELVRAGKVLYTGLSNFPAWKVARADLRAELTGSASLAAVQFEYSLVERSADRELLPMAEALGLAATTWSPLGGGLLTGKYRHSDEGRLTGLGTLVHTERSARETAIVDALLEIAAALQVTPAHVAIAWLRHRAARSATSLIPILGPRTRAQLEAPLEALQLTLGEEHLQRLEAVSRIPLGVPHEQLLEQCEALAGGKFSLLDLPSQPIA
ncbi:aldo/keto reductase [Microbulbifer magnicolonia]|uniref:aldo/keto reductase n=1 Tax=Microbulbifer magnicolonia TaxID=3109744 RepID=UPI002B41662C|nr:aldo/keto reductase [Microbulbifer sp. GG15]